MLRHPPIRAQTQTVLAPERRSAAAWRHVKPRRGILGAVVVACLLTVGCETVPMSYSEWKQEQGKRAKFAQAGIPYKSAQELRDEAADMRRATQDTSFSGSRK
jgi:hypothetical protein